MTDYINGHPIIAQFPTAKAKYTRAGRVIIVQRDDKYHPFVVAWQGRDGDVWDTSWRHGGYCKSLAEARVDFLTAVSKADI